MQRLKEEKGPVLAASFRCQRTYSFRLSLRPYSPSSKENRVSGTKREMSINNNVHDS